MKHISTALFLSTLAGLSLGIATTAQAQTAARFSTVEFKDTTLNDALEMIFQAANNPAHTIDPSASLVPIGSIALNNIQWDAALRTLANQNNFKVSRGADGSYLVEPREPILQEGMEGGISGGGFRGDPRGGSGSSGRGGFGSPGSTPFNPFGGGGGRPSTRNGVNFELVPSVSTQANAQTTPRFGQGTTGTTDTADQQVIPLYVRHIYVGGIAQLFANSSVISTQPFVSPASASTGGFGGGIGGGGGFGGGGFGGGGFGGQQGGFGGGGFGGQQGGFGGGGFGGQQGGFGGGGFGGGGFGGQQGGFGGGGFGGGNQFGGGGFGFGF